MRKKGRWLALALSLLALTGCSLARAEAAPENRDPWVGVYVYPSQGYDGDFYKNPNLEEYGSSLVETGQFGTLRFPQEVLFAVENEGEGYNGYTFPGLEGGYSLFYLETVRDGSPCTEIVSNMGPHDDGVHIGQKDTGTSVTLSGTIYFGPPEGAEDWDPFTADKTIWHYYNVYQAPDGRAYLNGHGDAANGPISKTRTETRKSSQNGETVEEETISVKVAVEKVPRLERLTAVQFDGNNALLQSQDLSLLEDRTELRCLEDTAWVLVEEHSAGGVERFVYTPLESGDPVSHEYILLDEKGHGEIAYLHIYASSAAYTR